MYATKYIYIYIYCRSKKITSGTLSHWLMPYKPKKITSATLGLEAKIAPTYI